jgi:dihydroorotase
MKSILILNAKVVNENTIQELDVFVKNGRIEKIGKDLSNVSADKIIDATNQYLLPGAIDDQVHFREPGLTHKANIYTESRAAAAGGVTTYMEMPNTNPQAVTQELLEEKYQIASKNSLSNYSFFMGTTNHNYEELMKTNPQNVCGIKIFMGSSTGDMLVDDASTLEKIFANSPSLIATHCEDDRLIKETQEKFVKELGENLSIENHPLIRSEQACYNSSSMAVDLAKRNGTRLHILHISTAKELALFDNTLPLEQKKITAEACIHHLWFSDADYATKGNFIKWNPAVKTATDRDAIFQAVLDDKIDVIATDHAPHTFEEKSQSYLKAPSGGPLVQHSIVAMLDFYHQGKISLEKIVQKMSHNVSTLFRIQDRGFIREGYWADLVLVDLDSPWTVSKENLLYKCGWSPFEGHTFKSKVTHTIVSGNLVFENGELIEGSKGERILFYSNR